MGPIHGMELDDDWTPPRSRLQPTQTPSSKPTKETKMSVTNEQVLEAIKTLTERVNAIEKDNKAALLEIVQAMQTTSNNMDHIHALLEGRTQYDQSFFQGQQHILQNLQFMQSAMSQLQASLSIAYPGVYNHPTEGLQYPARRQHFTGQHSIDGLDPTTRSRMVMDQMHRFGGGRGALWTQREGMIRQPYGQRGAFAQQSVMKTLAVCARESADINMRCETPWVDSSVEKQLYSICSILRANASDYATAYPYLNAMVPKEYLIDPHMLYSGVDETHESVSVLVEGSKKLHAMMATRSVPSDYINLAMQLAEDTVKMTEELLEANPSYKSFNVKKNDNGTSMIILVPLASAHRLGMSRMTDKCVLIEKQFLAVMLEAREILDDSTGGFDELLQHHVNNSFFDDKKSPVLSLASATPLIGHRPHYSTDLNQTFHGLQGTVGSVSIRLATVLITDPEVVTMGGGAL